MDEGIPLKFSSYINEYRSIGKLDPKWRKGGIIDLYRPKGQGSTSKDIHMQHPTLSKWSLCAKRNKKLTSNKEEVTCPHCLLGMK